MSPSPYRGYTNTYVLFIFFCRRRLQEDLDGLRSELRTARERERNPDLLRELNRANDELARSRGIITGLEQDLEREREIAQLALSSKVRSSACRT